MNVSLNTILYLLVVMVTLIITVVVTFVVVTTLRQHSGQRIIGSPRLQTQQVALLVIVWIALEALIFCALALICGGVIALSVRLFGLSIDSAHFSLLETILPLAAFVVWLSTFRRLWLILQRDIISR